MPLFFDRAVSRTSMRLLSLSVRLFANILAGHLLILFMGGGLAVLLGDRRRSASVTLPSRRCVPSSCSRSAWSPTLQAFIFATLTAIYLGGAVAESH